MPQTDTLVHRQTRQIYNTPHFTSGVKNYINHHLISKTDQEVLHISLRSKVADGK